MSYPYFVKFYQSYVFLFKYDGILSLSGEVSRGFFPGVIFLEGIFCDWYFSRGLSLGGGGVIFCTVIFRGYNQGNELMVYLLEYRPLLPSFNVGLGMLTVGAESKLNPLNQHWSEGERGRLEWLYHYFFLDCIFSRDLFPNTIFWNL